MLIGVPAETMAGETRVAATPETVKKLRAQGHVLRVQAGAGVAASVPDALYEAAGAEIVDAAGALGADLVLKVRIPSEDELPGIRKGATLVGMLDPFQPAGLQRLADAGITLTVVPGEREAALSFAGASCDFAGERILVVDVGGGSTELVAGRAGEAPVQAHSFDIGCRRVTEKFLEADPPSDEELGRARAWIAEEMRSYFDDLGAGGFAPERVVAVAGTATSVVAVHERMAEYDSSRVHRSVVERAVLNEVYAQLASVGLDERRRTAGLDPGRAPVIVAGLVILQVVLDLAGMPSFTVSESDILHGIVLEAARAAV